MKVYFDRAHVGENGAVINIDASFSGIELYIPKTWKLVNNMNVSLAGVEEKNSRNVTEEVTVTLTGDIKFSGIEIIYV